MTASVTESKADNARLWFVLESFVAACAVLFTYSRWISTPHCGQTCDFGLLYWTGHGLTVAVLIIFGGSVWGFAARRRARSSAWWVPVVGTIAICGAAAVAYVLSQIGLRYI